MITLFVFIDVYSGVTVDVPGSPVTSRSVTGTFLTSGNIEQQNLNGAISPNMNQVVPDSSDSEDDLEYSEDVNAHVMEDGMRMRKLSEKEAKEAWMPSKLHEPEEGERKYGSLRTSNLVGRDFEELERQSAQNYTEQLLKFLPSLLNSPSAYEIDQSILEFSSKVCDSKSHLFSARNTFVCTNEGKYPQSCHQIDIQSQKYISNYLLSNSSSPLLCCSLLIHFTLKHLKNTKNMYLSDICGKQNDTENCLMPILNADGIYMATYFGLLLNLKLLRCGYYDSEEKSLPISEVSAA